jgi:hypothetical protein
VTALVMAALSAREIGRRRAVVVLVVALPLWFYLVRRDLTGQSTRMLSMGIGWAVSTLTLFVVNSARSMDPRLRLTGASAAALVGGRLLAMTAGGVTLALGYCALVLADQDLRRPWAVVPMMVLTALVAAPFGALIGGLLPRELEGALALFTVVAVQMLANPDGVVARFLPFWAARELGSYAVDGTADGDLWRALLHAAITWSVCAGGTLLLFRRRLRVVSYPEP